MVTQVMDDAEKIPEKFPKTDLGRGPHVGNEAADTPGSIHHFGGRAMP